MPEVSPIRSSMIARSNGAVCASSRAVAGVGRGEHGALGAEAVRVAGRRDGILVDHEDAADQLHEARRGRGAAQEARELAAPDERHHLEQAPGRASRRPAVDDPDDVDVDAAGAGHLHAGARQVHAGLDGDLVRAGVEVGVGLAPGRERREPDRDPRTRAPAWFGRRRRSRCRCRVLWPRFGGGGGERGEGEGDDAGCSSGHDRLGDWATGIQTRSFERSRSR